MDVDQKPNTRAADLDCLRAQGVHLQRFGPSREPAEISANDLILDLIQRQATMICLPLFCRTSWSRKRYIRCTRNWRQIHGDGHRPHGSNAVAAGCLRPLAARAATEAPEIASVRDSLAPRYAVAPMQAEDPVGATRLRALINPQTTLA